MKKLHTLQVASADEVKGLDLPEHVQLSLGEIAGHAKEGLLALSVGAGLAVLHELMDDEVDQVVGPKGRHDPDRVATRHGRTQGEVTLGGRRVTVERPRVRSADGATEVGLRTYGTFAERDLLEQVALERMLAGVPTRGYRRAAEPVGSEVEERSRSTSRSAVSRRFAQRTRQALGELLCRRLDEIELCVLMLDGIELCERTHVVALGITNDGRKVPLGPWEGSTENAEVTRALLADLQERGLRLGCPILCVIDGAKALAKAVRQVVGTDTPIQRCVRHKERNVLAHLPERERAFARAKLRREWAKDDYASAREGLRAFARSLERTHPSAASSLREGLEETLTVTRLSVTGTLKRTLQSTNPIESMIDRVRTTQRNVKRWRGGDMRMRWTAAGMLEAERGFRRVKGHRQLPKLVAAIRQELRRNEEVIDTVQAA